MCGGVGPGELLFAKLGPCNVDEASSRGGELSSALGELGDLFLRPAVTANGACGLRAELTARGRHAEEITSGAHYEFGGVDGAWSADNRDLSCCLEQRDEVAAEEMGDVGRFDWLSYAGGGGDAVRKTGSDRHREAKRVSGRCDECTPRQNLDICGKSRIASRVVAGAPRAERLDEERTAGRQSCGAKSGDNDCPR